MIEPQNTMMPLPAESTPPEAANGEAGFGEMLAQTLGMVPQVDPTVIQQIVGNGRQGENAGEQSGDFLADGQPADSNAKNLIVPVGDPKGPIDGPIAVSPRIIVGRPPIGSAGRGDSQPAIEPGVVAATEVGPVETALGSNVVKSPGGDHGIWHPAPDASPQPTNVVETAPVSETTAANTNTNPVENSRPDVTSEFVAVDAQPVSPRKGSPVRSVPGPPRPSPADSAPLEPSTTVLDEQTVTPSRTDTSAVAPAAATPDPVVVEAARQVAVDTPAVETSDSSNEPGPVTAPTPLQAPIENPVGNIPLRPENAAQPRTPIEVDSPIQFHNREVQVGGGAVSVADTPVSVEPAANPTPAAMPTVVGDVVAGPATQVANSATPAVPVPQSALAARVMQAVEMQANQPPPRTMVVDIPEIEGLRLVVSVRSGAEVHVVQSSTSTAAEGLQSFMDELQGVLADRGFVMTGDGRRRGNNPYYDEQSESLPTDRPKFRRPTPTDNDLRI